MKIYELWPAPSARRVSIFLAEKGIEVDDSLPHLKQWYQRISERPSIKG